MRETSGFSRMEFQFPPNSQHVVFILKRPSASAALESPFQPNPLWQQTTRPKWRLHAAEADGLFDSWHCHVVRRKLKIHAAEADGLSRPGSVKYFLLLFSSSAPSPSPSQREGNSTDLLDLSFVSDGASSLHEHRAISRPRCNFP